MMHKQPLALQICMNTTKIPWSLQRIYTNNMVYILNHKDSASFIIQYIFSLYQGLNWGTSDPKTDDIPMSHPASFLPLLLLLIKLSVMLKGGTNNFEGNVYALNSATGVFGPICDDFWSMKDVRYKNVEKPLQFFPLILVKSF